LILLCAAVLPAVFAQQEVIIADTKEWRELYLLSSYSVLSNTSFLFFTNLGEAEVVMKMIDSSSKVTVYEPRDGAVVKNYAKYLELNGKPSSVINYDSYTDLQSRLFGGNQPGYILLEPTFGIEAISASPIIKLNRYPPVFVTRENLDQVKTLTRGNQNLILAGRFPIRVSNKFEGTMITGLYDQNAVSLTRLAYEANPENQWGIIAKIDKIDPETMGEGLPILIYYGEIDTLLSSLNATPGLTNFEVIGGDMADLSRGLERSSGRDLKLILKFAQTYTNLPGKVGKLYDLNTIAFDYPIQDLRIEAVTYYPELGVVAITFKNYGNVDEKFFTAVEFGGNAIIDDNIHAIGPGETKTVPYPVQVTGSDTVSTIINTRYGITVPFKKAITADDGSVVLVQDATTVRNAYQNGTIEFISAEYDDTRGVLLIKIRNPGADTLKMFGELLLDTNNIISSPVASIEPDTDGVLKIDTPYLTADNLMNETYQLIVYYGRGDTLLKKEFTIPIVKRSSLITGFMTLVGSSTVIIPLAAIMLVILIILIARRRKSKRKRF